MKIIKTEKYAKIIVAQKMYNPDDPMNPSTFEEMAEPFDPNMVNLPTLTDDDAVQHLPQDDETVIQEPQSLDETPELEGYPELGTAFAVMRWSAQNKEVVRIEYGTDHGKRLIRDVEPHGMFFAKTTGRTVVVTFDENAQDVRSYIVNNILDWKFTGAKFEPKFNFSQTRRNFVRRLKRRKSRNNRSLKMTDTIRELTNVANSLDHAGHIKLAAKLDRTTQNIVRTKKAQYIGVQGIG